jgi:hypothetical protein
LWCYYWNFCHTLRIKTPLVPKESSHRVDARRDLFCPIRLSVARVTQVVSFSSSVGVASCDRVLFSFYQCWSATLDCCCEDFVAFTIGDVRKVSVLKVQPAFVNFTEFFSFIPIVHECFHQHLIPFTFRF